MDKIWQILEPSAPVTGSFDPVTVLLSLLLAFVLGQVLAWVNPDRCRGNGNVNHRLQLRHGRRTDGCTVDYTFPQHN